MPSYATVIGASRGFGLAYVVQLSITDYPSLERAAAQITKITGGTLDCLIHNAARMDSASIVWGFDDYPDVETLDKDLIDSHKVNTLGVVHAMCAFLPLLRASPAPHRKIVVINSPAGDPAFVRAIDGAGMAAYGLTKAAALLAAAKYAAKLKGERFAVVSLAPGCVDTSETSGFDAADHAQVRAGLQHPVDYFAKKGYSMPLISPTESAEAQNGAFLNLTGEEWKA
ncbi:hypothetical protein C8Q80DRAFT_1328916 [Daedaleopsis nitida]|nr:hypothetical protein C8Q80DRAFT_1328916 [Daedaleopsis nitida]